MRRASKRSFPNSFHILVTIWLQAVRGLRSFADVVAAHRKRGF